MRTFLTTAAAAACFTLAFASAGSAQVQFGVSDDHGKYSDDGGTWFFQELSSVGLQANKMTVNWDPQNPDSITEKPFLDRALPVALLRGVHVSFGIHIGKARAITSDPEGIDKFTHWLQLVAREYPQVTEFVVGNEPNLTRFWQPQFTAAGQPASGIAFAEFLARSYDALKEVNPDITVVGVGLSPRGNDMPNAPSNVSTSPVKFIRDLGIGYKRLNRDAPIMDVFGFHPYPQKDRDPLMKGYRWPNAGIPNLDRIRQAMWDAFHGTAQPTFAQPGKRQAKPLTFKLDEVGWQVTVPAAHRRAYFGRESVKPTTEAAQARIYGDLVRHVACDPTVKAMLFFGLVDEANLDRWQAAIVRANMTRRPAWTTVRNALRQGCCAKQRAWSPTQRVVGAKVTYGAGRVVVRAEEDATVRVTGQVRPLRAYRELTIRVSGRPVVELRAAMNPARRSVFR